MRTLSKRSFNHTMKFDIHLNVGTMFRTAKTNSLEMFYSGKEIAEFCKFFKLTDARSFGYNQILADGGRYSYFDEAYPTTPDDFTGDRTRS